MKRTNFETKAIRIQTDRSAQREHSSALYLTSSFVFEDAEQARSLFAGESAGNIYTRFSNPNQDEFVAKLCALEDAEDGIATASGMAAVFAGIAGLLRSGDHLLSSRAVFGSTHQILTQILPGWGIQYSYVEASRPDTWEAALRPETRMFFLETPSNPGLEIVDLKLAGEFCARHGLLLNVDNCFATPYLQNPALWGAHLVTHSATKFIDGQGRVIGGAVVGKRDLIEQLRFFVRHTGPALSPFNSWVLSKSLETLAVRMDRHCKNALQLARRLQKLEGLGRVKYPFLDSHPQKEIARRQMKAGGGLLTFELPGGVEQGRQFLNELKMLSHSANLGDSRSIATHPASTTHSKLSLAERQAVGIGEGLIRISVGLEHPDDIYSDIVQAVKKSTV